MSIVNFHGVAMSAGILSVECKVCGRRANLTRANSPLPIYRGCMVLISEYRGKLKCSNQQCGSKEIRAWAPNTVDEAVMFEAGDPLPEHMQVI